MSSKSSFFPVEITYTILIFYIKTIKVFFKNFDLGVMKIEYSLPSSFIVCPKKSYVLNLAGFRGLQTSPLITTTVFAQSRGIQMTKAMAVVLVSLTIGVN